MEMPDSTRYRILPSNVGKMGINVIFCRDLEETGGCCTMPWHVSVEALKILLRTFFLVNPDAVSYQVEFVRSRTPRYGYRTILGIRMNKGDGSGTTLADFVSSFARNERLEIKSENAGAKTAQISITCVKGTLLVASIPVAV